MYIDIPDADLYGSASKFISRLRDLFTSGKGRAAEFVWLSFSTITDTCNLVSISHPASEPRSKRFQGSWRRWQSKRQGPSMIFVICSSFSTSSRWSLWGVLRFSPEWPVGTRNSWGNREPLAGSAAANREPILEYSSNRTSYSRCTENSLPLTTLISPNWASVVRGRTSYRKRYYVQLFALLNILSATNFHVFVNWYSTMSPFIRTKEIAFGRVDKLARWQASAS